jgi:hypothetical protein
LKKGRLPKVDMIPKSQVAKILLRLLRLRLRVRLGAQRTEFVSAEQWNVYVKAAAAYQLP